MLGERAARLRALVAERATILGVPVSVAVVCETCSMTVGVDGTQVSLWDEDGRSTPLCSVGPLSDRLEELRFTTGEGPAVETLRTGGPVLVADLAEERHAARWPVFVPAALQLGARAVFSLPLQVGAARVGVLELTRHRPGPLEREALADALSFASLVLRMLLDGQAGLDPDGGTADDLFSPRRAEVHQATGMVAVHLNVDVTEALARMRGYAFAHDEPLSRVAARIISGDLRLETDDKGKGPHDA
ncbi:GAF and ANTAR domain-containing protein [Actinomadura gamaensis]|uniref:GAF and ANTAR domain-containing protein n=1 Tax=Actinomadura gamaensis TaxID=1763541 RepID=A0ABV9U7Y5_9ACTN